ncbi:MAG TPA: hypothetical protein VFE53_08340 [Mucilaginibacter sp.]|nr:hypothetical protein [Mucilaginibacter sp.]
MKRNTIMLFKRNVFAFYLALVFVMSLCFLCANAQRTGPGKAETMAYLRGKFLANLKDFATINIDIDTPTCTMKIYSTHAYGRVIFIHFDAIDDNFTQWMEYDNTVYLRLQAKVGYKVAEVDDFQADGAQKTSELHDNITLEFYLTVSANTLAANMKDEDRKKKRQKKLADSTAMGTMLQTNPANGPVEASAGSALATEIQGFEAKTSKAISWLVLLCGGKSAGPDPFANQ